MYLHELEKLIVDTLSHFVIAGGYNTKIPGGRQLKVVAALLDGVLQGLVVPTADPTTN